MNAHDETRTLRRRLDVVEKRPVVDRVTSTSQVVLGQVIDGGNIPTTMPGQFLVKRVRPTGALAEAGSATLTAGANSFVCTVFGATAPSVGDYLIARTADGRWVSGDSTSTGSSGRKICINDLKFCFGCYFPSGFQIRIYKGWTTGTTPTGTLEHTATITSLPYCYTTETSDAYGIILEKTDWVTLIAFVPAGFSASFTLLTYPYSLTATDDNGPHTLMLSDTSPFIVGGLSPFGPFRVYFACVEAAATTRCAGTSPPQSTLCSAMPTGSQTAYTYRFQCGNSVCNPPSKNQLLLTSVVQACFSDDLTTVTYSHGEASCDPMSSPHGMSTTCKGGLLSVQGAQSVTVVDDTDCSAIDWTYDFAQPNSCDPLGNVPNAVTFCHITL